MDPKQIDAQLGGYTDKYLPLNDFEGKSPDQLDFGEDYTESEIPTDCTDKLQEISPMLYDEHLNNIENEIMYFWQYGFLSMNDITQANPLIRLTTKAFDQEALASLPKDKLFVLEDIKRILIQDR